MSGTTAAPGPGEDLDVDREAILRVFVEEVEEGLQRMEQALVALEARPDDAEQIGSIFRVAHSLKGNAFCLGLPAVSEFAHVLEDLLDLVRAGTVQVHSSLVTLLLEAVDAIRVMLPEAVAGVEEMRPEARLVMGRLAAVAAGRVAAARPAPAARSAEVPELGRGLQQGLRVDRGTLDRMVNLTGEIAIARGRILQALQGDRGVVAASVLEAEEEAGRLQAELQELVMRARMVPLGPTLRQQVRAARDAAAALGKQVRVTLEGEDVEVDASVVEHIHDPLTHMVRNAVDHGVERPDVRRAQGKDPCGHITLRAEHQAGSILVSVSDDGAGLDRQRIAERARDRGLAATPEAMADEDLFRLVFEPGFSTAERVTDISGRGVGMDVVRRNIEALRGSVSLESRPGQGTTVTLRLPLTLAIIEGFAVRAGEGTYVIPLDAVVECVELAGTTRRGDRDGVLDLRGQPLPYLRLREVFALEAEASPRENVVVVRHGAGQAGLAVDALLGARQTVIRPLGRLFKAQVGLAGATIQGDGRVALILDVPALLRLALERSAARPTAC